MPRKKAIGTQQPAALPTFRWRPDLVSGMPVARDIRPFAAEIPRARFAENEKPNFLPIVSSSSLHYLRTERCLCISSFFR
jgi:hypothetical protein